MGGGKKMRVLGGCRLPSDVCEGLEDCPTHFHSAFKQDTYFIPMA